MTSPGKWKWKGPWGPMGPPGDPGAGKSRKKLSFFAGWQRAAKRGPTAPTQGGLPGRNRGG